MAALTARPCALLGATQARRSPVPFLGGVAKPAVCVQYTGLAVSPRRSCPGGRRSAQPSVVTRASDDKEVTYNKEFGYSRKDVILIGVGLIALGYALYYGLQAMGMEAGFAGNWVQLIIFMGICVFWVSTYIFRVATKQMTYVKQLENYEEAVMKKRIEEMTEAELEQLASDVEGDRQRQTSRGKE